jgi:hypothetical protein
LELGDNVVARGRTTLSQTQARLHNYLKCSNHELQELPRMAQPGSCSWWASVSVPTLIVDMEIDDHLFSLPDY